jgi:hypothetical protein
VWFIHARCNFYTQSVISTRTHTRLASASIVRFLHAECTHESKFDTYAFEFDTPECDLYTLEWDSYTQSVISKPRMRFQNAWVWFQHAECEFNPQSVILHTECDIHSQEGSFDTYACDLYTKSGISTRILILTFMNVITTLTTVISTRRVWFYTQIVVFTPTRVILTRVRVNMTLASVMTTRSRVISTRRL